MNTTFGSFSNGTLADRCYDLLKRAIRDLDLAPGAPIDEGQIAAQLGISKTPVREALARLSGEGFVVPGAGRRSFVAELSLEHIREIYHVRIMLETASVREVAPTLSDEALAGLARCVDEAEQALAADDLAGFIAGNERFHSSLIECSENRYLIGLARGLFDQASRVNAAVFRVEQRAAGHLQSTRGIELHRRILDALAARDGAEAAEMLRLDIQTSLDAFSTPAMRQAFAELSYHPQSS